MTIECKFCNKETCKLILFYLPITYCQECQESFGVFSPIVDLIGDIKFITLGKESSLSITYEESYWDGLRDYIAMEDINDNNQK